MKSSFSILSTLKKSSWILIKVAGSLLSVGTISLFLFLVYLSISPLYLDFLLPYVRPYLTALSPAISFERAALVWREWNHPFELQLETFYLRLNEDQNIHIPQLVVHLDLMKALQGKLVISKATVSRATLPLGGRTTASPETTIAQIFDPTFLEKLNVLVLEEPAFLFSPHKDPLKWSGLSLTIRRKKDQLMFDVTVHQEKLIKGSAQFNADEQTLQVFTSLENLAFSLEKSPFPPLPKAFSEIVETLLSKRLLSGSFEGSYDLKQNTWRTGKGVLTDPFAPDAFDLQVTLQNDRLILEHLKFDLKGLPVTLQGQVYIKTQEFSGELMAPGPLSLSVLSQLWPQTLIPDPREWIFTNISEGTIKDIAVSGKGNWNGEGLPIVRSFTGQMLLEGIRVSYLKGMPAVTNACGKATFDSKQFLITLTRGALEQQTLEKGTVLLNNLDNEKESLALDVSLQGPISNVLTIIDHPPLEYTRQLDIQPSAFQGTAQTHLKLDFPLKKDLLLKDVTISVESRLSNVAFSTVIGEKKAPLALKKGKLTLKTTQKKLTLEGTAEVNQHAAQVSWEENLGPQGGRSYSLKTSMTPGEVLSSWNIDLHQWISGLFDVSLVYRVPKGKKVTSLLELKVNFQKAALDLPFLSWKKPVGQEGTLSTHLEFMPQGGILLKDLDFKGKDVAVLGSISFSKEKALEKLHFSKVKAPDTHVSVDLTYDLPKGYALTLKGESFNFSSLFSDNAPKTNDLLKPGTPFMLSLNLQKGVTGKGKTIDHLVAQLKGHQGKEGLSWDDAQISGLTGTYKPIHSKKSLEKPGEFLLSFKDQKLLVRANDAGAFLKTLGLHNEIKKGSLVLESQQPNPLKPYEGHLKIKNFEIKDMPILTRLLALSSPTGIIDLLSSENLLFGLFEARFSALNDQIIIHEARAVSAGLGIPFKGTINRKERTLFLTGNIIPAYMINSILSNIPLVGDLFFGGKDSGFLATRFVMKGPLDNPQIDVNPLQFLAPGFLKHLFEDDAEEEKNLRSTEEDMKRL